MSGPQPSWTAGGPQAAGWTPLRKGKFPGNNVPSNKVGECFVLEEGTQRSKGEVMMRASSGLQSIAPHIAFERNGLKSFTFHSDF